MAKLSAETIDELPANFAEFVAEYAAGLEQLYGKAAAHQYRRLAPLSIATAMSRPNVKVCACRDGRAAQGLLVGAMRDRVAQVTYLHVLERYAGDGIERCLIEEFAYGARANGAAGITAECVTFGRTDVEPVYRDLGFRKVDRLLMAAALDDPRLPAPSELVSQPLAARHRRAAAEVIAAAYAGDPGRDLHVEVRSRRNALEFLQNAAAGAYGPTHPLYIRAVWEDNTCAAVIVGAEPDPETGFVLQVATRPECRRKGYARRLILDAAHVFRAGGMKRLSLGVTCSNPARRLYEALGFEPLRPVSAYVWWRDAAQTPPQPNADPKRGQG